MVPSGPSGPATNENLVMSSEVIQNQIGLAGPSQFQDLASFGRHATVCRPTHLTQRRSPTFGCTHLPIVQIFAEQNTEFGCLLCYGDKHYQYAIYSLQVHTVLSIQAASLYNTHIAEPPGIGIDCISVAGRCLSHIHNVQWSNPNV